MTCIFQNAGEEGQDPLRLIKRLARFTYVTDSLRSFVAKAVTPDDIVAAKKREPALPVFHGQRRASGTAMGIDGGGAGLRAASSSSLASG